VRAFGVHPEEERAHARAIELRAGHARVFRSARGRSTRRQLAAAALCSLVGAVDEAARADDGFPFERGPGVIARLRALLQLLQARSLSSILIPWAS
jgi:hypothetical protein